MPRQEDFVFAERALQRGYATEEQVQECLSLLERLRAEMSLDESLANLMVKKGYLAPAQAHVLEAEIDPSRAGRPKNAIEGYRLLERIGSGAMGSVYKADHLKLLVPVALKVLRPSLASSRTQIERLKREAQLAARLSHPNVVRSLDVGESNGFHYLAMEFVEGATVRELLSKGPIPEKEALGIVRQVASALAHAHGHGVVHRDVKPGNIMLTREGVAKLADFGLARGKEPSDLTLEHASIGTPQYVAPEQMRRGSDATPRSDLFSLGATLYHMVTGRPPFDGQNLGEIVQNVLSCRFPPPESVAPGLSRETVYVLGRLMRGNPRERYAGAADLVADLERIERGEAVAPPDFLGDYQSFLRRRRTRRNAILAAGTVVLAAFGAYLYQHEAARRENDRLREHCAVAAAVGADAVGTAATLDDLGVAIAAMERAEAGASGCDDAAIRPLRERLGLCRAASGALAAAEAAFAAANTAAANYCEIDARLAGLRTGLKGVDGRIESIRREVRGLSDKAATERHNRLVFHDAAEVMQEARAFAKDLERRYLALDAPWVGEVAQAPRLLDAFEEEWARLDEDRRLFESALEQGVYNGAAARLDQIRTEEETARERLFRNPYLARLADPLSVLPPASRSTDQRARDLRDREAKEWEEKVLPAADGFVEGTPPRPDLAEEELSAFLKRAHATRQAVLTRLEDATRRREALEREQLTLYASDEALFRNRLRERAYARAYQDVAAVAGAAKWLPGPAARYRALLERATAVAALPARFLEAARKQKTMRIRKGVEVPGKEIEASPGENRDLFVARRGKERIEFTLAELELPELERVFAFEPRVARDKSLGGWFGAAEAFRADVRDPYDAERLRREALAALPKEDPWLPDIEVALGETRARIKAGEERAAQAAGELKAAKDAGNHLKALSLCQELLTLKWTKFCHPRLEEYTAELEKLQRIASRQLLPLELGVPEDQVRYDGDRATITFTGRAWCPVKAAPGAPAEEIDGLSRRFWEDWFRSKGKTEKQEIDDLSARAMTQRLSWRGAVEVGPEGGYLPGAEARIADVEKEWYADAPTKPESLRLDFPFLPDQPWAIEAEVRWPTPQPGYFALGCGEIQAVVGYFKGDFAGGGMKGACLVEAESMDPRAFAKQIVDLQWVEDKKDRRRLTEGEKEKAYLDSFVEGAPYRMRLERTRDSVVFEMWPLGVPGEKRREATVHLEKRYLDPRKLERLVTLSDGRTVFRFFGAPPGKGLGYELHDVAITGTLGEKRDAE